uniref:Uncharacterized protein n=1 Tax=Oryza nivara TaxID=4536 RepID=A0A0E0IZD7_ORYNI
MLEFISASRRRRLLLSTAARSAAATPFSVEEYLVDTCGLTGAQALKASKKLSHLRSPAKPDAVLAVLSGVGLSRADLAAVVAAEPQLLCARADNIARRIASLRDRVGLSDPQIGSFLLVAGGAKGIHACDVAPRLEFWIPFLGSFETLLRILKGNNVLVLSDLEKVIKPNIALLQECGLTVCDIAKMARFAPRMFTSNPKQVEGFVRRADELGVPRTSGQFKYMVGIFANISEGSATARMEYLSRSLGCSMDKLRSAVQKLPQILGLSETNLGSKIEFLVGKVRLEPEYLLKTPKLFTYSLEKRLVARHYIVQVLAAKGLKGLKKDVPFCSYVQLGESCFVKNFIDQHENVVPGLSDAYAALRAGKVPPEMELLSSTLGCSMDELRYAICKSPQVLGFSETKLRAKIRACALLAFSLEKRLVPRHYVAEALAVKGLIRKGLDFYHCVYYLPAYIANATLHFLRLSVDEDADGVGCLRPLQRLEKTGLAG